MMDRRQRLVVLLAGLLLLPTSCGFQAATSFYPRRRRYNSHVDGLLVRHDERVSHRFFPTSLCISSLDNAAAAAEERTSERKPQAERMSVSPEEIPSTTAPELLNIDNDKKQSDAKEDLPSTLSELKAQLLNLLSSMTGQAHEYRQVEALVNSMEGHVQNVPMQTLAFFNLALQGLWQLLFSTQLSAPTNPRKFRVREMIQSIQIVSNVNDSGKDSDSAAGAAVTIGESHDGTVGNITNRVLWDWNDDDITDTTATATATANTAFSCTGTFSIECAYRINPSTSGSRMSLNVTDHVLRLGPSSAVPKHVPTLVAYLHRSMPKELFDPTDHAMDTTYIDADLRIVRYTGPRLEGIRDIFVRTNSS